MSVGCTLDSIKINKNEIASFLIPHSFAYLVGFVYYWINYYYLKTSAIHTLYSCFNKPSESANHHQSTHADVWIACDVCIDKISSFAKISVQRSLFQLCLARRSERICRTTCTTICKLSGEKTRKQIVNSIVSINIQVDKDKNCFHFFFLWVELWSIPMEGKGSVRRQILSTVCGEIVIIFWQWICFLICNWQFTIIQGIYWLYRLDLHVAGQLLISWCCSSPTHYYRAVHWLSRNPLLSCQFILLAPLSAIWHFRML